MKNKILLFVFMALAGVLFIPHALAASATVTWNANSESDLAGYKVYYGTSPRTGTDPKVCTLCGYATSVNVGNVTSYVVGNLTSGQTYYFSVTAYDTSGNESAFSAEVSKQVTTLPVISNVVGNNITTTGIVISWNTNINTNGQVFYGLTTAYGSQSAIVDSSPETTSHTVTLSGLSPATLYHFKVTSVDGSSNSTSSPDISFTTASNPDTTAPTVSISSPAGGTVSGSVTFSASASDPTVAGQVTSGLKSLTLYVDGSIFATSSTGSISVPLDTTTLTNASHTLSAIALDNAGNQSTTATVAITVNNTVATKYPRTIQLTSLEGIASVPANTAVTVTILSPSSGTTLETQSNLTPTAGKYTVTFQSTDPQIVNIRVKVNEYLSQLLTGVDTTVNSGTTLTVPQLTAADLNNDNAVNALDYSIMNSHWLANYPAADINQDGIVNSLDFAILKNDWNKTGQ